MNMMSYAIVSVKNNSDKLNALLLGMKGVVGCDLFAVSYDDIYTVVSDIRGVNLIADKVNALTFAGVIDTLARQFTLLPVRFGSLMGSADAIVKMLERNRHEILQNLLKVENKFEFGLKVFCDSGKLMEELRLKSGNGERMQLKPSPEIKNSVYRDYLDKKLAEHRLEESMLAYVDASISEIAGRLEQLGAVNHFKKMVSEALIIDAVFLLEKDKKAELIQVVRDLQHQNAGLRFVLTGPWPPYNFVDLDMK